MLQIYSYRIPFKKAFNTEGNTFAHREGFILKYTEEDIVAYGEIAPLPGFSYESIAQIQEVLAVNKQPLEESLKLGEGRRFLEILDQIHAFPALSFGIDTLLHDLKAKKSGQTLPALLSANHQNPVLCNAVIPLEDKQQTLSSCKTKIEQGFNTLKLKVGTQFNQQLQVLTDLHHQYPDLKLRIDANESWSVKEAITNLQKLSDIEIEYCEQPVSKDNLKGLKEVKEAVDVPIAADESIRNKNDVDKLLELEAADLIIIKPMLVGSFENICVTKERADTHGIDTVFTTSLEAAVGRASTAALAAALASPGKAQGLSTGTLLAKDVAKDSWLNGSSIYFSDAPGLGISVFSEGLKELT